MGAASLVQLLSSCIGIVGSLFFVIGVVRQSTEAMGKLSQSHYDANPYQPRALAMQKADYVFGGGLIVAAFALQFLSFLAPSEPRIVSASAIPVTMGIAFIGTILAFLILRIGAGKLGKKYEQKIQAWLAAEEERYRKEREAQKAAQRQTKNAETQNVNR